VRKEQNGRKSLRRLKHKLGCNDSKRIRRRSEYKMSLCVYYSSQRYLLKITWSSLFWTSRNLFLNIPSAFFLFFFLSFRFLDWHSSYVFHSTCLFHLSHFFSFFTLKLGAKCKLRCLWELIFSFILLYPFFWPSSWFSSAYCEEHHACFFCIKKNRFVQKVCGLPKEISWSYSFSLIFLIPFV